MRGALIEWVLAGRERESGVPVAVTEIFLAMIELVFFDAHAIRLMLGMIELAQDHPDFQ